MDTYFGKIKYIKVGTIVTENVTGENETEVVSGMTPIY